MPHQIINAVGPAALTGEANAAIRSDLLGRPVRFGGDDTAPFEKVIGRHAPNWMAMNLRLMLDRFQQDGMLASFQDVEDMTSLLGRPPRSYRDFAAETLAQWQA